jgi:hypothetical protein
LTTNRPTPKEWADTIEMIEARLVQCGNNPDHWYPSDGACVICEVDYNVGRRKRPASAPNQPTVQMQVPLSMSTPPSKPATHQPAPVSTRSPATPTFRVPQTSAPATPAPAAKPTMPTIPPAKTTQSAPSLSVPWGNLSGGLWWAWIVSTVAGIWGSTLGKIVLIGAIIGMCAIGNALFQSPSNNTTTIIDSGSSGSNSVVATDVPAEIPTDVPVATAMIAPAPTEQPTAVVVLQACNADGTVAAAWPMLNDTARNALRLKSVDGNLATRYGTSIDITKLFVATSSQIVAPEQTLAQCGDGAGVVRAPFGTAVGMMLDCQINNSCTQQIAVMRQAQLVIRNQTLFAEVNIDPSKSLLSQFSQRSVNKNTITVAVVTANQFIDSDWESLVAPLIQTPLVTTIKAKGKWINASELISNTVQLDTGALTYDDERGIIPLTQPTSLNQLSRTIDVSKIVWSDGTPLSATDYVRWFVNCPSKNQSLCPFFASIIAKSASKITITYIPGLPATLANLMAPEALKGSDQSILTSQSGVWRVVSRSADTITLQNASNTTLKIQRIDGTAMQPFLDALRQNGSDLVIVAPEYSAAVAAAIAAQPLPTNYAVELVPTGAIYTYKTP